MDAEIFSNLNYLVGIDGKVISAKKPKKKRLTWADYIYEYAHLPSRVMNELWKQGGIQSLPTLHGWSNNEKRFLFEELEESYRGTAYHLAYNLLTKDEFEERLEIDYPTAEYQLFQTDLIVFKEDADRELDLIKLLREYRRISPLIRNSAQRKKVFESVERMWHSLAWSDCWNILYLMNILENGQPINMGKTEFIRTGRRVDKLFKSNTISYSKNQPDKSDKDLRNIFSLFMADAAKIANDNDNFNDNYWYPWWEKRKTHWDKIESNENCQLEWITTEGERFQTGNGRRLPKADQKTLGDKPPKPRGRPPGSRNRKK